MKCISLCIALVIIANSINAQFARFGVKGGTVISFPSAPDYDYKINDIGTLIGILVDFKINQQFTARLETYYVDKSIEYQSNGFIDIPLDLIYNIPVKKNKFLFGAGPALGIRTTKNDDFIYRYFSLKFKKTDFGINLLTGYEFAIGLSINLNYTHGFVNMIDQSLPAGEVFKNRMLGITVGYLF